MAGFDTWVKDETAGGSGEAAGLQPHQLIAAAAPHLRASQLAEQEQPARAAGNFHDFQTLLDQLGTAPVFELGKPLPKEEFLSRMRIGSCPAAHNRALLDEAD